MVLLIIIPIKWLFHWEYSQHFQTHPYVKNLQNHTALNALHLLVTGQCGPHSGSGLGFLLYI